MGKRGRRKRRETGDVRISQRTRRRIHKLAEERDDALFDQLTDPAVPVDEVAKSLVEIGADRPIYGEVPFQVCRDASPDRARAIGEAALGLAPEDLTALTFAAGVAEFERDDERAASLLRTAAQVSDEDQIQWRYAAALLALERTRDAFDLIERECQLTPPDELWQLLFRDALGIAYDRRDVSAGTACPCNSGTNYSECCMKPDRAALARFNDRSTFDELCAQVSEYAKRPELAELERNAHTRWFGDEASEEIAADKAELRLFREWSWTMPLVTDDERESDDRYCVVGRFADETETPKEWRSHANEWLEWGRYGLWQVRNSMPAPGIRLKDLLTGTNVYAALLPEHLDGLAPWTVLLGAVVPMDGIWRTGAALVALSPSEADSVADDVRDMVEVVAGELLSHKELVAMVIGELAERANTVEAESLPPASDITNLLVDRVMGVGIPHLVWQIGERRSTPPQLQNTDGSPMLLITAEVAVADPEDLCSRLDAHPDFDVSDDVITWLGREMTPSEAETSMAEFRAWAEKEGVGYEEPQGPQRWARGRLERNDGKFHVDVNSRERLDTLMSIFHELGARPEIVSETRVDPAQDFAFPPGPDHVSGSGMSPEALAAWQRTWVDESVPALGELTPREAAKSEEGRILLEGLLRELEHRSFVNRSRGRNEVDVEALRIDLGMHS